MKQKNMILVGVAVVCGLIAAFLTSQMSARSKSKAVETVKVPQAVKDLPIGTKLKGEEINEYVKFVEVPKESAPQLFVEEIEQLKNKRVTRTMRANDVFNPQDVTSNNALNPPEGYSVMTIRTTLEEGVAGFVLPGTRVDVLASVQLKKSQRYVVFPLFTDMLVLAVDSNASAPEKGGINVPTMSMVSFAVDARTSLMLQAAMTRGAQLRLTLRHSDKPVDYKDQKLDDETIWDILTDRIEEKEEAKKAQAKKEQEQPKAELVKVAVPTADLTAGTPITDELLAKGFHEVEYPKALVPENAARDLADHAKKGHYLLKDVAANSFVPKTYLGDKPEPKETKPDVVEKPEPLTPAPKKEYVDMTVESVRGTIRHRYEKLPDGGYKYVGVTGGGDDGEEKKPAPKKGDGPAVQ